MTPQDMKEFFSPSSIVTFTGATAAVWILSNAARMLTGRDMRIVPFIISLVVAFLGAYTSKTLTDLTDLVAWFLVLLNGCLLFLTAGGAQGFTAEAATGKPDREARLHGRGTVKFLTPWFKN